MKTRFASCVILFQETLGFRNTIALCYGRRQSVIGISKSCAKPLGLGVIQVVDILRPIV